jgi:hypothetical protein
MHHPFVCPACGHETAFDPARCPWHLVVRPDGAGGTQRRLSSRVRCPKCGREEWVPAGCGQVAVGSGGRPLPVSS